MFLMSKTTVTISISKITNEKMLNFIHSQEFPTTISGFVEKCINEYFDNKDGIMVIEWAEKLGKLMPNNAMQIKMESTGESERKIWLSSGFQARLK